jgi:hypothetical protein
VETGSKDAPINSALFVDFDNIYIGLRKSDPEAAERFASNPSRWLSWFEQGMPGRSGEPKTRPRQILIRRCYPNPDAGFRRYRSFFTSAAFTVIDCPALTQTGKNSADIHMVMDLLDTLGHPTRFDEFIILSGDSDFMPVLLRLRAYNRRTTTVAIGMMPAAYRAACDLLISEEEFIELALQISADRRSEEAPYAAGHQEPLHLEAMLRQMAARVFEVVSVQDEIAAPRLPYVLKDFREFRASNDWMGFRSSMALAEALAQRDPRLQFVKMGYSDYKIVPGPLVERGEGFESLGKRIVDAVKRIVAESPDSLSLARVSGLVTKELGEVVLSTRWAGAGSFKKLLQSVADLGLAITILPPPGYIFDPARHPNPMSGAGLGRPEGAEPLALDGIADEDQPLTRLDELARRVEQVTGTPSLGSKDYSLVFQGIVEELQRVSAGERSYNTYASSQTVSQWLHDRGLMVSASDIAFVFKGLIFQDGARFGTDPGSYTVSEVGRIFRDNVVALCRRAQLELSDYELQLLDDWILGEAAAPMAEAPAALAAG